MFQKEVAFILDGYEEGMEIFEVMKDFFYDWKIKKIFWDKENAHFFSTEGDKESMELFILESNLVINLLDRKTNQYKIVEKKLEIMKIPRLENSLKNNTLFKTQITTKQILKAKNIKTPVFEKINNRDETELFVNFPQPSKILEDTHIEEFILGEDFYSFVYKKKNGEIIAYQDIAQNEIINQGIKKIFKKLGIEKFALLQFKFSKQRGLYLLNVFTDLDIFVGHKNKIIEQIFGEYGLKNLDFLLQ